MRPVAATAIGILLVAGTDLARADDSCQQIGDARGDAAIRRTDWGADGALHPESVLPDILSISVCSWAASDPAGDPYTGWVPDPEDAHLFRLELVFAGLVNPPGRVLGSSPDPFLFGPSPLIGFLDIDVDHKDSGGELGAAAESRYLANVARFGRVPDDSLAERTARGRADLDNDFYTEPQYERSGADFALVLCGCDEPSVVSEDGDLDGQFEEGETWIVRSRLFERAQGYQEASAAYGGSAPGLYDPWINVRFSHDSFSDETTVTVVWALDMTGSAELADEAEQQIDLDVGNHTSVLEALQDIIDGADIGGFGGPGWILVERWEEQDATDHLEPGRWEVTGLFGLPYLDQADGTYAWTDTAGEEVAGDCDGDGELDSLDEALVRSAVYGADGGGGDADGVKNGRWVLQNPGWNFSLYDLDGDYTVAPEDIAVQRALGDFDWSGVVNTQDFIAFLNAWVARQDRADFNMDQKIDTLDFVAFLNAWVAG